MIELTKLGSGKIYVNPDKIETVDANPDTLIILTGGRKLLVEESPEAINSLIEMHRKS